MQGLTVAALSARSEKEARVALMVGSVGVCVWRESGVGRSGFVLVRLAGIWL
jgi:hypothetical protein